MSEDVIVVGMRFAALIATSLISAGSASAAALQTPAALDTKAPDALAGKQLTYQSLALR